MSSEQWIDLFRTLGIAGPLVGVLVYMLREATTERKDITARFLAALQTTVEQSSQAVVRSTDAATRVTTSFSEFTRTLTEYQMRSTEEHRRIVDVLDRLSLTGRQQ